jgi:acyl-coenzyme A thioesterase PaaI-like protein
VSNIATTNAPINLVNEHNCFGCGTLNLHGLQLVLNHDLDGNGVWATFTPDLRFEGYGGMVHGGIISTVLDEVMAWSLYRIGAWGVTAEMNVRFRKPVRIGEETRATGRIIEDRGRVFSMGADIRRAADGVLLADATARFMRVPMEQANAWRERYESPGDAS